jgi:hypothetical protein
MSLEYVLNELSVAELMPSVQDANAVMDTFVDVLKSSRELGIRPSVRTHISIEGIELSPGYFISNWCSDQTISKEKRLYIRKLLTNSPLLEGLPEGLQEDIKEVGVKFNGLLGNGLTVAFLAENPVLSFNTHARWEPPILNVTVERLTLNAQSNVIEVIENEGMLINFSTRESLGTNKEKVRALLEKRFTSIDDFWSKREQIFSRLEFSLTLFDDLKTLGVNSTLFVQVVDRLSELNRYCETWTEGPCLVREKIPNISVESASTMQTYGEERKFKNHRGEYFLCELHCRLTPGANRVHFFPLVNDRKIFVGYVGKKLRTTSTPT